MGELENERLFQKEKRNRQKEEEEFERKKKSELKSISDQEKEVAGVIKCREIIDNIQNGGISCLQKLKVEDLKAFIRYQFKSDVYKTKGIKKADLLCVATKLYESSQKPSEQELKLNVPTELECESEEEPSASRIV